MDRDRYTPWPSAPVDWHSQDWLPICEALLRYADSRPDANARGGRARKLAAAIAIDQDLRTTELYHQVDHRWPY